MQSHCSSQPQPPRASKQFGSPGGAGAFGNSLVWGFENRGCTHHLDGVDVEMVSSSSLGVDGRLRVWLAGKFFAGLRTSRPFPIVLWAGSR